MKDNKENINEVNDIRSWASYSKNQRTKRMEPFLDSFLPLLKTKTEVHESKNGSYGVRYEQGFLDFYPKSDKLLVRSKNKWLTDGVFFLCGIFSLEFEPKTENADVKFKPKKQNADVNWEGEYKMVEDFLTQLLGPQYNVDMLQGNATNVIDAIKKLACINSVKTTWRFVAWENQVDHDKDVPFFLKDFTNFNEMKLFSAEHHNSESYPNYISDYIKIMPNGE